MDRKGASQGEPLFGGEVKNWHFILRVMSGDLEIFYGASPLGLFQNRPWLLCVG